jgi:hypothetical protein
MTKKTILILKVKLVAKTRGVKVHVFIEVLILVFNNDFLKNLMTSSIIGSSLFGNRLLSLLLNLHLVVHPIKVNLVRVFILKCPQAST